MYAHKGVPGVRIPLSPPFTGMIAGPRGTKGCEPRQVRKEAAVAITTFAVGSPVISVIILEANHDASGNIAFLDFITDSYSVYSC